MTSNPFHTPQLPTDLQLKYLETLDINVDAGTITNSQGRVIGYVHTKGYVVLKHQSYVGTRYFRRSHIVWWKATGKWPVSELDHINRKSTDDRYANLREVSHLANMGNNGKTNGLPVGVSLHEATGKFAAYSSNQGSKVHLGYFDTPELALQARTDHLSKD